MDVIALLWIVTVASTVTSAQSGSPTSVISSQVNLRTPRTTLLAQVSDTESRPLSSPSKSQTSRSSQKNSVTSKQQVLSEDPLKRLAERLSAQALEDQKKIDARPKASQSSRLDSKPIPMYQPAKSTPTDNEVRSKELLLSHPSEHKPLGTPGQSGVPESPTLGSEDTSLGLGSDSSAWVLKTITSLGVVIGLILALRMGINKLSGRPAMGSRSGIVEVLSRTSISPRNQVLLLRLGQRIIVVSEGPAGVRTLANLDDPDEVAQLLATVSSSRPGSITQSFNQLLNRAGSEMDNPRSFAQEHGTDNDEHAVDRTRDELSGLLSKIKSM
ncbi:MAG: FliO/MopB family protein, partial [Phycisphaeraceae bacterium]|nr:FliO/MopB family protein [Phycisphaeraceae bacterium]